MTSPMQDAGTITALVLAAQRDGTIDPLAARFGLSHKCLVPIGGRPLIEHVLLALAAAPQVGRIIVSIDQPDLLDQVPLARTLRTDGRLEVVRSRPNLADSVVDAAKQAQFPLLVTTADNALFTPQAVTFIHNAMRDGDAALAAAFARKDAVLAAHPEGQRRFYTFADDGYANCNCYWISAPQALEAARIFRSGGQFAKHPMRIAQAFGIINLVLFRMGIGTLAQSFARFSRRLRLKVRPVVFADGSLAIDVDNDRTYAIVAQLLDERAANALHGEVNPGRIRQTANTG